MVLGACSLPCTLVPDCRVTHPSVSHRLESGHPQHKGIQTQEQQSRGCKDIVLRGDAFNPTLGEEGKKPPKNKVMGKRGRRRDLQEKEKTSENTPRSGDGSPWPEPSMQGMKQRMLPCTELQGLDHIPSSLGATEELSRSQRYNEIQVGF